MGLKNTVYTAPHRTRSIIDHHPTLDPAGESPYSNRQLADAYQSLLNASGELGHALESIGFVSRRNDDTHTKKVEYKEIIELRKVLFDRNILFQIGEMVA